MNKIGSNIVLTSLSCLLGVFLIFMGIMKITPHISKDLHKDLVSIKLNITIRVWYTVQCTQYTIHIPLGRKGGGILYTRNELSSTFKFENNFCLP